MNICMITSASLPPREGIGVYTWNLTRELTKLGHQVQIITRGHSGGTSSREVDGIRVWDVQFLPVYPFHVHLHGRHVDRLLAKLAGEIDLLHLHSPLVQMPLRQNPSRNLPTLVTVHTPMRADAGAVRLDSPLSLLIKLQAPVSYRLEQQLFDRADRITAVASSVASELAAYGVQQQRVNVVGNGVDTATFCPATAPRRTARPYALTVARLAPRKGLADLLACAERVVAERPDLCFRVAGTGPMREWLAAEITKRGLVEHVELLGHIGERSRLIELYQNATVFVHPAHYEGLPTVLLEAMACGCPVITTAVSGALDVVQHGNNGLLTPPHQPDLLAARVLELARDPSLRTDLGRAARQTVTQDYTWSRISQRYVELYKQLLQKRPVPTGEAIFQAATAS